MSKIPFVLGYWGAPRPEVDRYKEAADCGFLSCSAYTNNAADGIKLLNLAQAAGMKMVIYDLRIDVSMTSTPGWQNTVKQVIADYSGHPALLGYFVDDEPCASDFPSDAQIAQVFRECDPEHPAYYNLLPSYASAEQMGTDTYQEYVSRFVCEVQPALLSYDHYTFLEGKPNTPRPSYFTDMLIIRQNAQQANIPYFFIFQTTPELDLADPSAVELRWQVYTALAHGYRGLVYFSYWTEEQNNARDSIVDMYGTKTWKYQVVRDINMGVQALLPHLDGLSSTAVYQWPDAQPGVPVLNQPPNNSPLIQNINGGEHGEFVIGCFKDANNADWVMVVNRNFEYSSETFLTFNATSNTQVYSVSRLSSDLKPLEAVEQNVGSLVVKFWLAPGDGILLSLVQNPNTPELRLA